MKIKSLPDDFQVEEQSARVAQGGPYALYRLTKHNLGTPEAIDAVCRRWNLHRQAISVGGLKDRHATTVQWLTIDHGPRRDLAQTNFRLDYQGQTDRPFDSKDIAANAFSIVLRDMALQDTVTLEQSLAELTQSGVPNYFDQQRFGSVGESGDFVARPWCLGDYERAVWLAVAEANPHDRPRQRTEKATLRDHWGDWATCRTAVREPPGRDVVAHLAARPDDFRGAITRVPAELRSLYLAAFQSELWNRMLTVWLRGHCRPDQLANVPGLSEPLPAPVRLEAEQFAQLRTMQLPLPTARTHLEPGPIESLARMVLEPLGLEWRQLRVKYPRDSFFSKGDRSALFFPEGMEHRVEADEVYPGRRKVTLRFRLPRGCYATMILKRIGASDEPIEQGDRIGERPA